MPSEGNFAHLWSHNQIYTKLVYMLAAAQMLAQCGQAHTMKHNQFQRQCACVVLPCYPAHVINWLTGVKELTGVTLVNGVTPVMQVAS